MIEIKYINTKGLQLAENLVLQLKTLHPDAQFKLSEKENPFHTPLTGSGVEAFVFIGALGILVRKYMPAFTDKHTDAPLICIDTTGKYVIPVLGGHVAGANDLAREIAGVIGAEAVVTTQSDNLGLWPLDTLAKKYGWIEDFSQCSAAKKAVQESESVVGNINEEIARFVNGESTALLVDVEDEGTNHLLETLPDHVTVVNDAREITKDRFRLAIIVSPMDYYLHDDISVIHYIPQCVHVGIGLAHQAEPANVILAEILNEISMSGICIESIADFNTIDLKAEEPVVKLLQHDGMKVNFFKAEELNVVDVPNPSDTVNMHVGTPSVSEASAMLYGKLILEKHKGNKWTVAASISTGKTLAEADEKKQAHIEIVGAGPGDPDLISVRGRRFLEQADLILYAGSLVPRELTYCAKSDAVVRSSADMNLEEQFKLMKEFYDRGKLVVRLHTGDPCIYGAIQEQMAFFDKYGMDYHITPGISSFLAAAAELRSQFTIPERCQTIILTRGEGRTPMPDKEKLNLLASHQSTMCIFLSASIVEDVQKQLLDGGYLPDTPVAACYKLTWKDQRIYRGKLNELSSIVKDNNLTLTTMIVVGDAIDNRHGLSKLYDKGFAHLFRGVSSETSCEEK